MRGLLYLNLLESPSPKGALKLAQWFLKRYLNDINIVLLFHNYLPFEKGMVDHFNETELPSPEEDLCQIWLKLVQLFLRRCDIIITY